MPDFTAFPRRGKAASRGKQYAFLYPSKIPGQGRRQLHRANIIRLTGYAQYNARRRCRQ